MTRTTTVSRTVGFVPEALAVIRMACSELAHDASRADKTTRRAPTTTRFATARCYRKRGPGGSALWEHGGLIAPWRARVGDAMTFGYVGYIWALFGCCSLGVVFGGSAAFLYAYGKRRDRERGAPTVTVDRVDTEREGPGGSAE